MQTLDWKELKEGDFFSVKDSMSRAAQQLHLTYNAGTVYQWKGEGWVVAGSDTAPFKYTVDHTGVPSKTFKAIDMPVQKYDEADMGQVLPHLMGRVGSYSGTDPEVFVVHGEKESLLPAFRFLKPQKKSKTGGVGEDVAYPYCDGFAAESWVLQRSCHEQVIGNLCSGLSQILNAARKFDRTAKLSIKNTFRIPKIIMDSATDDQIALGCAPSLNAYGEEIDLPSNPRELSYRFAGGHIHLATRTTDKKNKQRMVKGCDLIAGIAGVAIFDGMDSPARRQFYGRAGEYRIPTYGIEYRTLSNAWLGHPAVAHLMFNLTRCGAKVGLFGHMDHFEIPEQEVQNIINFCDVANARKFVAKHRAIFEGLLKNDGAPSRGNAFRDIVAGGVRAVLPNYGDIETTWGLADMYGSWHVRWQNVVSPVKG